ASYLMYPKVFCEFAKTQDRYGPTAVLPTPTYFYGLEQGEELLVDIEKGKTLVLQYLGQSETNEKGQVRVFFDPNGQPRTITVPDRMKAGDIVLRPKAESGDPKQVGAPMPGVVSSLAVKPGQTVAAGDVLCSIEAMKMETAIHAETGGVLAEVLVKRVEEGRDVRRAGPSPVRTGVGSATSPTPGGRRLAIQVSTIGTNTRSSRMPKPSRNSGIRSIGLTR